MTTINARNAANSGWIELSGSNTKLRNASNSGWLSFDGSGSGGSTITSMSVSALSTIMDVSGNANHQVLSGPAGYGLWTDGFPHPYRDGSGNTYLPIPHSENFRFRVPDWNNGASWVLEAPTYVSARVPTESIYNNRHWIFGVWAAGNTVYALTHHEWYVDMVTRDGVPGFNANSSGPTFNHRWVNSIGWATSTNGGATFAVHPNNDASRLVLVPEPWSNQARDHMYGFFHPTNIVQEGSYYYAACEQRSLGSMVVPENGGAVGFCATTGMSLIRTATPSEPTGWQFWNGATWVTISHATYQGNGSTQVPYRFFQATNHNFYAEPNNFNSGMGHCIRFHPASGKWVIFGYTGSTAGAKFGYTTSPTLANPQFNTITGISGSNVDDFDAPAASYFGVFDPAAPDQNFMTIGNTCTVLVQRAGVLVRKGTLTITVA